MITKYLTYIKENVNHNQFFTTYEETKDWLDKMMIRKYRINKDLTVDVDGHVNLFNMNLKTISVKFGIVNGEFNCENNKLTSLDGSPKVVRGVFRCYNNNLTTLEGSPEIVNGNFRCSNNPLSTLIGLTKVIGGYFDCYNNKLTSLEGFHINILKKSINTEWYKELNSSIKEEYFDKILEDNPEIISLINFELSKEFKDK